jgi:hypothetical protein
MGVWPEREPLFAMSVVFGLGQSLAAVTAAPLIKNSGEEESRLGFQPNYQQLIAGPLRLWAGFPGNDPAVHSFHIVVLGVLPSPDERVRARYNPW